MSDRVVRALGLLSCLVYGLFILWLYGQQPRTLAQVVGGVAANLGAYRIDEASFAEGLRFFRDDQFEEARAAFARADPAQRDAVTQFYVGYSYYRQGWGRLYHDDALYREGLAAVARAIEVAPAGRVRVADASLGLQTADELKAELERGLRREASDFNPLRIFRGRR